ncbi:chromosome segregation protein SMC [Propionivibrio sp.]|uniref:chromosome segregation protein SMC n=1 Tax=Propionivibrio sp. TaxID=2212460 RepID=UPI0025D915AD|nr:chromosome segregation protein SMC [Propionivibrio sp.]MBK7356495.1 chromosome segregation protein SMC [Propionivibrio sp.]MBK8745300.1 chromosome segregation protein SMC [Propionivibrio sp.]MBK8894193.1 chromosome segregation protein SMC [Propionivibrio sp.]MBL0207682.1 chromosome segregation protein SMC [Propionivibrio sp.]
MRLTKLKLAGFKSFVDPTTISLPGQLVGVVGPNGCGKSNVMDAVRWVLGESKASELRGESMQDVIFNGADSRKPVSRAAVELVFDNSLGRISGQWSQYAELSVKRLLTRNGQSEYYINNLHVRRKDVTDLFLGTGLGPRAYAIIGQGTISRIIEARPDELRVFLEEAAGVTKYKERRKETESRIADTRDNLARVEDIRLELGAQMERLEGQATVARQYREHSDKLARTQHLLWLLKRNEAQMERERLAREIDRTATELEAQNAALRDTEARLEVARESHFSASDGVHGAQSALFSANAEVARLEAEIRHRRESKHEYESRLAQLSDDKVHWANEVETLGAEHARWLALATQADERVKQGEMQLQAQQERLPLAEAAHASAQGIANAHRAEIAQAEQQHHLEQANRGHALRSLQIIAGRRERLAQEREALPVPDSGALELKQDMLAELRDRIVRVQEGLALKQQDSPRLEQRRREVLAELQQVQKERAEAHARRAALEQLQKRVQGDGKLGDWLRRHRLENRTPLWKSLHVEAGWEDAVEAVLRERISALTVETTDPAWSKDRPGSKLTLLMPLEEALSGAGANRDAPERLLARIRCDDPQLAAILADWLNGVSVAPDLASALAQRERLSGTACCITPEGDIVNRQSVTLFAPDAAEHGLLERQREIDDLGATIHQHEDRVDQAQARLADIETSMDDARNALQEARQELENLQELAHGIQVETLKLSQALDRFRERQEQIDASLTEMIAEEAGENGRLRHADAAIDVQREQIGQLQRVLDAARAQSEQTEQALADERHQVNQVERALREAQFTQRECRNKIEEITRGRELALKQVERIDDEFTRCAENAEAMQAEELEPQLQEALDHRVSREQTLAAVRDALEAATNTLRGLEEQRMQLEHTLEPLRERIGELKLKEQAASLNVDQFAAQLHEAKADESGLAGELAGARVSALQSTMTGLQRAIESLGAVNLAALEELEAARERKTYLDAQSEDLTQAMETLENAIRRIDRETRDLLQNTFDSVNRSFGELFPTLFGGGEARLILTGEEILDSGLQVMAQPPGKKNTTIHLLSGGEKALTAIALVFSMFQLNPAPFCLLDEVDAPLDDTNTERFCAMVRRMAANTQFLFISHNKIAMEMAQQLIGVTMQESGVSRIVEVDMEEALRMREQIV